MSYFQATTCKPHGGLIVNRPIAGLGSTSQYPLRSHSLGFHKLQRKVYPRLVLIAASHKRPTSVCALSGKGNPDNVGDVSSFYGFPFMLDISWHANLCSCVAFMTWFQSYFVHITYDSGFIVALIANYQQFRHAQRNLRRRPVFDRLIGVFLMKQEEAPPTGYNILKKTGGLLN